jgi:DNA-binding response OmpR family regulator
LNGLSYDTAEALVFDPVAANHGSMRAALSAIGFREIESVSSHQAFTRSIRRRSPDLAVCEVQSGDTRILDMIQALRGGATGYNPFIVIIVTTWDKSKELVRQVLNCGADDLILRPFSTGILASRIDTHTLRRKGFVITYDYIGPDRRFDPERLTTGLFQPPNSLKMKAVERLSPEQVTQRLEREMPAALKTLHTEKVRRDAFQICILWRMLHDKVPGQESYVRDLAKIGQLARAIARRAEEWAMAGTTQWCDSLLAAVEGLEQDIDRTGAMHLLGHAAMNLNQLVSPEKTTAEHLVTIDEAVAAIKVKLAAQRAG